MDGEGTYPPQVGQDSGRCLFAFVWESGSESALFRRLELVAARADVGAEFDGGGADVGTDEGEVVGGFVAAEDAAAAAAAAASCTGVRDSTCTPSSDACTSRKARRRRVCSSASEYDSDRKLSGSRYRPWS